MALIPPPTTYSSPLCPPVCEEQSLIKAMGKESHRHQLLVDGSDDSDDDLGFPQNPSNGRRKKAVARSLAKAFIFLFVLTAVSVASLWAGTLIPMRQSSLDRRCAAHTTHWSPLLKDVPIQYQFQVFNGSFLNENIYRQTGSPEVDQAWEALGVDYHPGIISYIDGLASGLKPSFAQRAEKYGGGFVVNVEGMHHLHCLNLLRKALYFNYDRYKKLGQQAFKNEEYILRRHVTHCLDILRQVLMCNVDTGVLGQVWVDVDPEKPTAFPDFNTRHSCKNYDDIREWARKIQAPPPEQLPEGYMALPGPGDVIASIP